MSSRAFLRLVPGLLIAGLACAEDAPAAPRRFFSDDSFWNQPIAAGAETAPRTERWTRLLETEPNKENWLINCEQGTIPVYEADASTPPAKVGFLYLSADEKRIWHTQQEHFGHGKGFDLVPIPREATPDPRGDAHLAAVDWKRNLVWDMWALKKSPEGSWSSATGMVYAANGPGVFRTADLGVPDGESVHFHGP